MPNNIVQSFAKKSGKSIDQVEKLWQKAKAIAAEEGHVEDYAYITGILKKMLSIKEEQHYMKSYKDYIRELSKG